MKLYGRYWAIILAAGFVIGVINPYIGLIAGFNFNEIIFIAILLGITFIFKNINNSAFKDSSIKSVIEYMVKAFAYMIPIFFFVLITAAELITYFKSFYTGINYSPYRLLVGKDIICHILLVLTIGWNVFSLTACICRTKRIKIIES